MSYSVQTTPSFERAAKRLARKYPHFKDDLRVLIRRLADDPFFGIESLLEEIDDET